MKDWIEERLTVIWKLDEALSVVKYEGQTDLEWGGGPEKRESSRISSLTTP
jgi:hypothetical protein